MLVFPDSGRALECAAAIQRAGRERPGRGRTGAGADRHARRRGDPRGRLLRPQRDPRAWIAARARGGEILVSEQLKDRAEELEADRPAIASTEARRSSSRGWRAPTASTGPSGSRRSRPDGTVSRPRSATQRLRTIIVSICSSLPGLAQLGSTRSGTIRIQCFAIPASSICARSRAGTSRSPQESAERKSRSA